MEEESKISKAVRLIRTRTKVKPLLGIVLGSGFASVADLVKANISLPYKEIPGFSTPRVGGHPGIFMIGQIAGCPVAVLQGRVHFYEGRSMEEITFPVRMLAALGVKAVLLTNAAGGINRRYKPGDFVALKDHINFIGTNPLRGAIGNDGFVDLSKVYDSRLLKLLSQSAVACNLKVQQGVYLAVSGPSFETPAEIRAFGRLGADLVGMSTVPEAIIARQCGVKVAGISCVTNLACGIEPGCLSHQEVLKMAGHCQKDGGRIVKEFCKRYGKTC